MMNWNELAKAIDHRRSFKCALKLRVTRTMDLVETVLRALVSAKVGNIAYKNKQRTQT